MSTVCSGNLSPVEAESLWPDPTVRAVVSGGQGMSDRTYIVRFKPPQMSAQLVVASSVEIQGDHIVLLNSNGQLAALLLLEVVESWSEVSLVIS